MLSSVNYFNDWNGFLQIEENVEMTRWYTKQQKLQAQHDKDSQDKSRFLKFQSPKLVSEDMWSDSN